MIAIAFILLLASAAAASGDVAADWRGLQTRCTDAVTQGAMLDVTGLEARDPKLIAEVVEEPPYGVRIEYDALRVSARTVPTGIWGLPGGRFEMTLLEFTTKPGLRAICEVTPARGVTPLTGDEIAGIVAAFANIRDTAVAGGTYAAETFGDGDPNVRMVLAEPNPRGCPVVVSLSSDPARGTIRSSAAERAGAPGCGGPSLASGGLTRTPASLNPRGEP